MDNNKSIIKKSLRLVAVIRKIESKKVPQLVNALINGGITNIEITMDSNDCNNHINNIKEEYGDKILVGAGTVLNQNQAKDAICAGADFIVAPILEKDVIDYARKKEKIMIPGVFTPTEVYKAHQLGADMVKLFPANVLGTKFIKDIKGPLPNIPIMTTGGINLENISEYFQMGVKAVGVGSSLIKNIYINQNKWEEIKNLASKYVQKSI